jgi:hypothetical protein
MYIPQRGVFVSLFISTMGFGYTSYMMSKTGLTLFLYRENRKMCRFGDLAVMDKAMATKKNNRRRAIILNSHVYRNLFGR